MRLVTDFNGKHYNRQKQKAVVSSGFPSEVFGDRGHIVQSCPPQHDDELEDSGEEDNYEFASHANTKNSDIIRNHYQSAVHWW